MFVAEQTLRKLAAYQIEIHHENKYFPVPLTAHTQKCKRNSRLLMLGFSHRSRMDQMSVFFCKDRHVSPSTRFPSISPHSLESKLKAEPTSPKSQRRPRKFKIGMRVRVNDAEQILASLDNSGRLDGLPFMPMMIEHCEKVFTVTRWVNNVCFQTIGGADFGNLEDCVLLDVSRCNGQSYGNCQMACPLIWKTNWLTPADSAEQNTTKKDDDNFSTFKLIQLAEINSQNSLGKVFCQATQLHKISPPRRRFDPRQYTDELALNRVSTISMATSFCSGMLARAQKKNSVVGTLKRTPVSILNLKIGETARVKTQQEIVETLDTNGKNRGLWFDPLMLRYCGTELKVSKRITTLVDEVNGVVRNLKVPSVVLEDLKCEPDKRRFCSRLLHLFWREIWLERV